MRNLGKHGAGGPQARKRHGRLAAGALVSGVAMFGLGAAGLPSVVYAATSVADLEQQLLAQQQALAAQQKTLAAQQQLIEQMQKDLAAAKVQQSATDQKVAADEAKVTAAETEKAAALNMAPPGSLSFSPAKDSVVTFYGAIDVGLYSQTSTGGPGLAYKPNNAGYWGFLGNAEEGPNIGLKGKYVLGNGWWSGFDMGGGVSYSGTSGTTTFTPFNRAFNVQIGNVDFGSLTIGQQTDPAWAAIKKGDPRDAKQTYDAIAGAWSFGQGTSSAQGSFYPTNAFSYKLEHGPVTAAVLYKPPTSANSGNSYAPLANNNAVGQQESAGLTYDDGTYLATAAIVQKFGTTNPAAPNALNVKGMDMRDWGTAVGYHLDRWFFRGGVTDVYLPHGNTAFLTSWANAGKRQDIFVWDVGAKWGVTEKDAVDLSYYFSDDRINAGDNGWMIALGNDYKISSHLAYFIAGAVIHAGANATPISVGPSPSFMVKPGTGSFSANTGVRFRW